MTQHSLIPTLIKKTLEPFRTLERSFNSFWKDAREEPTMSFMEGEETLLPDIDVFENDKEFHVTATIPGIKQKDFKIEVNDGFVTLRGERKEEKSENRLHYHISESSSFRFSHKIQLPYEYDEDNIEATLTDGMIDICIPKLSKNERDKAAHKESDYTKH